METKHKEFKPFDKVLVRDKYKKRWKCDFYSHKTGETGVQTMNDVYGIENVLPYEGNEALVGTTDEPDDEVKLEEGELIFVSDDSSRLLDFSGCFRKFRGTLTSVFATNSCNWAFAIRFSDFNPNDMEETRKHILCVKNGKVVKYNP